MTGCVWADIPKEYGSKSTAHRRFQDWWEMGVWQKMLRTAIKNAHAQHKISMQKISVDSSLIPAKKRGTGVGYTGFHSTTGTKIHIASNQKSLPLFTGLNSANIHDSKMFGSVLDGVRSLCGRKMYQKIETISADKGYDTKSNRKTLGVYIESTAKTNEGMNKWNEDMDFIAWYVEV